MSDTPPKTFPISNEEDNVNHYLAQAIREELRKLQAESANRSLPNSQSDSALNAPRIGSLIPDYLTGFKIPLANSPGGSTTSSLRVGLNNINFNQGGSSTSQVSSGEKDQEQEMETDTAPPKTAKSTPKPTPTSSNNPFQERLEDAEKVIDQVSESSIPEEFYDSINASQFFGNPLSPSQIDSLREDLIAPSQDVTSTFSDTFIVQNTPSRLRRSGRLLSKKANLGIKVPSSKSKVGPKQSVKQPTKSSKTDQKIKKSDLGNLFSLGTPGLTQALKFPGLYTPQQGKQTKRSPEVSPEGAPPRKQSTTASRTEKQLVENSVAPPREQRSPRSRTRDEATPTRNVYKQTHVASEEPARSSTPAGVVHRVNLGSPSGISELNKQTDSSPWPSAHNLDEFTSNLTPVQPIRQYSNLHIKDIMNEDLDPELANKLMNLPKRRSSTLESSSTHSSSESIPLC